MNMRLFQSLAVSSIVIVLPLVGQTATRATKESALTALMLTCQPLARTNPVSLWSLDSRDGCG